MDVHIAQEVMAMDEWPIFGAQYMPDAQRRYFFRKRAEAK